MNNSSDPAGSVSRLRDYFAEGERRAAALNNRGPIRYGKDGKLHPEIVEIYNRVGLYIFEGVVGEEELDELRNELLDVLGRTPAEKGGPLDRCGKPAVGAGFDPPVVLWSK